MGFGLLRGVENFTRAHNYSTDLRLSTNLLEPELFYQAAKFDAKKKKITEVDDYLEDLGQRMGAFFATDRVHGRELLRSQVKEAMESPTAGVTFLLGRRNAGKTKILMQIVKEMNAANNNGAAASVSSPNGSGNGGSGDTFVVYVDGRKTPSLKQGIRMALRNYDDKNMFENVPWEAMKTGLLGGDLSSDDSERSSNGGSKSNTSCTSFNQLFSSIKGKDDDAKLIELIVLLAAAKKKRPCLVVDEASICLPCKDENKSTMATIYSMTKDQAMNILLASSDFDYPRQIASCSGIMLSMTRTLLVEELSPKSIWGFLVEETDEESGEPLIGMGNKLARFCISYVGGDLRMVQHLLNVLRQRKGKFSAFRDVINYDIEGATHLEQYLDEKKRKSDSKKLMKILENLGETGFWEIEPGTSAVVERLVRDGVANSVLTSDLLECPLTEESFRVLVPSSQVIRFLIVEQVNERSGGLMDRLKDMFSKGN